MVLVHSVQQFQEVAHLHNQSLKHYPSSQLLQDIIDVLIVNCV